MKKIVWVTDPHLDFLDKRTLNTFFSSIKREYPDYVLISGDISGAIHLVEVLELFEACHFLTYFVLGNHDFYFRSILEMRKLMSEWNSLAKKCKWLQGSGIIEITQNTCLIGYDGWYDGRCGDFFNSSVNLNDYDKIKELTNLPKKDLFKKLNSLGDESAFLLETLLESAAERYSNIIILTHIPPMPIVKKCDKEWNNWAPHFECKATGDLLKRFAKKHSKSKFIVFSGHTHIAEKRTFKNLTVQTGHAEYGFPNINKIINLAS